MAEHLRERMMALKKTRRVKPRESGPW